MRGRTERVKNKKMPSCKAGRSDLKNCGLQVLFKSNSGWVVHLYILIKLVKKPLIYSRWADLCGVCQVLEQSLILKNFLCIYIRKICKRYTNIKISNQWTKNSMCALILTALLKLKQDHKWGIESHLRSNKLQFSIL